MLQSSAIRAILKVIPSEKGGRKSPILSGYRPTVFFPDDDRSGYDAIITLENSPQAMPGDTCLVSIRFLHPEYISSLRSGRESLHFTLKEGLRTIAHGEM
jgi:elongation factor Tu